MVGKITKFSLSVLFSAILLGTGGLSAQDKPVPLRMMEYGSAGDFFPTSLDYLKKRVLELYNVDLTIELVSKNSYEEKANVVLASGEYPDIMRLADPRIEMDGYENNVFLPITKEVKASAEWQKVDSRYFGPYTFNSDVFALPDYVNLPETFYYRVDWVKKLGLKAPTNLKQLTDLLYAFAKKDPDGNGKDDTFGLSIRGDLVSSDPYWRLFAPGLIGTFYLDEKDKTIKNTAYSAEDMKKALTWFIQLYKDGVLDKEWFVDQNKTLEAKFLAGKTGFWVKGPQWITPRAEKISQAFPGGEVTTLPTFAGPYGAIYTVSDGRYDSKFVTKKTKNPDLAKKVLLYWNSAEAMTIKSLGEPGKNFKIENGKFVWLNPAAEKLYNPGPLVTSVHNLKLPVSEPVLETSIANAGGFQMTKDIIPYLNKVQKYQDSYADLEKMTREWVAKFILGSYSLDRYDEFLAEFKKTGAEQILGEVNKIYKARK